MRFEQLLPNIRMTAPCGVRWDSMTPTEQGRFCAECKLVVIDFTRWSDAQILAYFEQYPKGGARVCGRIQTERLHGGVIQKAKRAALGLFAGLAVLSLGGCHWFDTATSVPAGGMERTFTPSRIESDCVGFQLKFSNVSLKALSLSPASIAPAQQLSTNRAFTLRDKVKIRPQKGGDDWKGLLLVENFSVGDTLVLQAVAVLQNGKQTAHQWAFPIKDFRSLDEFAKEEKIGATIGVSIGAPQDLDNPIIIFK